MLFRSPEIVEALSRGLARAGCDVIDIGMVPTPVLYFATHHLGTHSGVSVTGSHNPPEYNGLKIMLAGETLAAQAIQGLRERIVKEKTRIDGRGLTDVRPISVEVGRGLGEAPAAPQAELRPAPRGDAAGLRGPPP